MHGGEVGQQSGKPGTETRSGLGRDIRPRDSAAGTFHTTQPVFGDPWSDVGNFYHLATKVVAEHAAAVRARAKRFVTNLTRLRKDLLDHISLLGRDQNPVYPLVTRLSSRFAMPGFLGPYNGRSACRTVRRGRFRGIGRISREQGHFTLQNSSILALKCNRTSMIVSLSP